MRTKRLLAALLAAVMTFTCLGVVAFAALPAGANYDDNMDSYKKSGKPTGWDVRHTKSGYDNWSTGKSGVSGDDAYGWLVGIGNGGGANDEPGDTQVNMGWTYGRRATVASSADTLKNTTVAYNIDVKVGAKTVWAQLFSPSFNGNYPVALTLFEGDLLIQPGFSGTQYIKNLSTLKNVGKMDAKEWHNVGAVIKHSTSTGIVIDIYFDSKLVYTYTNNSATYKNNGLTSFEFLSNTTSVKGMPTRYDTRGETVHVDNFYVGDNPERAYPTDLWIEKTIPAKNTVVPVDSTFSIVTNQGVVNFNEITEDALWLKQKNGTVVKFDSITNGKTVAERDTITGTLSENLYYSEEYTLHQSSQLKNSVSRNLQTETIKYTTKSMFPVTAEVTSYAKSTGTASAELALSGNTAAMKLVMAAYDKQGVMVDYTAQDIAANQASASISVSYSNDETIKIFAVDNFSAANLVMEPIIDGAKAKSYKQTGATTVSVGEPTTEQKVIAVEGETDTVRGWVLTKVAKKGNEASANLDDYLSIDAVQADDNGKFSFAGRVKEAEATYVYKATAVDSNNTASGEVEYILETGNELLSLTLNGKRATLRGNEYYLKLKNADVRGMFVEFSIPYKAILLVNGEELTSGTSRIDFTDTVKFVVRPEMGEEKAYDVVVDVEVTDDYDDRNDNLTVIVDGTSKGEGEEIVDPGEYVEEIEIFTDVKKGYWAEDAIEALYEKGVVGGKDDGTFAPNQLITREEFASMIAKAFGYSPKNTRMVFEDVKTGAWYENAVYALAENGVASGVAKYKFGVGQTITRQDMTVMLYNIVVNKSVEDVREYKNFSDQSKISAYAVDAVEFMYKAGFVSGMEDGTFNPFGGTTKAMAAYMIYSIMN